ncbi:MAG: hypothetical protein MUF15_13420 [Acidobacteria bacterium]|nr:hypothetical protein [Acidobacteriota bacterium]
MKIKLIFLILISFWATNILCLNLQAKSLIYDILDKGSTWTLVVDGEEGTLELLGGRGSSTGGMGWRMSMDVRWQGRMGNLRAEADNENSQQRVFLSLKRNGEIPVICEGYIAQERMGQKILNHPK